MDFDGSTFEANYDSFSIGSEDDEYKLQIGGYDASSTLLDAFSSQNGRPFSTKDRTNGATYSANGQDCAARFVSGEYKENECL